MVEMVANPHMHNLVSWAEHHPEGVVLSGDLTGSTEISLFRDRFPDRFFSMGMAEQNMISFAGGLAREGYVPLVHTFAVFMYRRALDQIEMSVAYPNQRVRLFGFLPGVTTPGGASHQAINDIGVLRSVPNMTVMEMGDATDVESVLAIADGIEGPLYVRMLRKGVPRLFPVTEPTVLGRARPIAAGTDVTLLTSGICTAESMAAVEYLQSRGVGVDHFHISTLKPFGDEALVESAARSRYGVVTFENHSIYGGLATAAAELLARHGVAARLVPLGIEDTYIHGASQPYLMNEYGLTGAALVRRIGAVLGENFDFSGGPESPDGGGDGTTDFDRDRQEGM
jgi:transketolase